jgi:hypothetical protein
MPADIGHVVEAGVFCITPRNGIFQQYAYLMTRGAST